MPTPPHREAFARCYQACAESLYLWLHLHPGPSLRGRICAEDLVQETWCRAYQHYERYDPARPFKRWLIGIAENVLAEELRRALRPGRSRAGIQADSRETVSTLPADLTSISERAARSEFVARLLEFAESLPRDERQLLLYRGVEELRFEEFGERLSLTPEAARSRWRRLRERCQRHLVRCGVTGRGLS